MFEESTTWLAVHYVHLIAMAFFVGGQLVVAAAIVPVERRYTDRTRMRAIGRRFGVGSVIALIVLAATGIAMASHYEYWSSGTLQIKLILVGIVIVLTTGHLFWPRAHVLSAVIFLVSLVIVWLGLELAGEPAESATRAVPRTSRAVPHAVPHAAGSREPAPLRARRHREPGRV